MTEREKMISGELYDPTDKELEQFLISPAWMYVKYMQIMLKRNASSATAERLFHF